MRTGGIVVVVAIVGFGVAGAAFLLHEREKWEGAEPTMMKDASADARPATAKKTGGKTGKPKTAKGRAGTTRVSGHRAGGGGGGKGAGSHGDVMGPAEDPLRPRGGGGGGGGAGDVGGGAGDVGGGGDDVGGGGERRSVRRGGGGGPSGPSYESAIASNDEKLTIGDKSGPDLTDEQLSAPMRDGSFIGDCGAPDDMGVTVKVAIRMGRAVGVSVYTDPSDPEVAGCVQRHVRGFSWPAHPKTDSFVTTY